MGHPLRIRKVPAETNANPARHQQYHIKTENAIEL